ncbi:twin-arginine translocation signal domain-containing protein [Oceaniglobus trochenteri]|uniref:twin-arginine translocation signal domain-containing protein n=1 Tax=Oceaniglobus trochenteri TaxID=2763260 RepID=UPI001CFF7F17
MTEETAKTPSRRAFLKLAGTAAPAAVAATALASDTAEAAEVNPASSTMQDTAHTRAYLASTRF